MPGPGAKIDIRLSLAGSAEAAHFYEVAGLRLASDLPIGQLEPFAAEPPPAGREPTPPACDVRGAGRMAYAGPGWVGGVLRQVESRRCRGGYLLQVEAVGEFAVSADGAAITCRQPVVGRHAGPELTAALLGPCLALALAERGIWCLHAGGAGHKQSAVALIGESGSGKSTLAASLAAVGPGWRLVADDLLPVRPAVAGIRGLPRFPQPNLPPEMQWPSLAPGEVELAAIYLLEPGGTPVELQPLTERDAALALVRHSVAARLFDRELQAHHLDFCAEAARRVPLYRLRFPRRREVLAEMIESIAAEPLRPPAAG